MSEADLLIWLLELAAWCGVPAYHTHDSRRSSSAGFPDLVLVRAPNRFPQPPWLLFWELKTQRGRLSPAQRVWLAALGAVAQASPVVDVRVVRPDDRPEVERLLMGGLPWVRV